jgi:hypothetical protein
MPHGKAAGVRCVQLSADNYCGLFGKPERPAVCSAFLAGPDVCGSTREEAIRLLDWLERSTALAG